MTASIPFAFVLVSVVIPVAFTLKAFRSPSWRQMKRWATDANVTITENNEQMIRQRLGRARRYRSVASLPFWWLVFLPSLYERTPPAWTESLIWVPLTAYVLGSMLAGASDLGPADGTRTAILTPRVPSRYVIWPARIAPWVLLSLSGVFFALSKVFPPRLPVALRPEATQVVAAVIVATLAELVIRLIAARPQPAMAPSLIDADDALRSTGATAAIAAALLVSTATLNTAVSALLLSGHRTWLLIPIGIPSGVMTFAAFIAIMYQAPWLPRRPRTAPPASTPACAPTPGAADA